MRQFFSCTVKLQDVANVNRFFSSDLLKEKCRKTYVVLETTLICYDVEVFE